MNKLATQTRNKGAAMMLFIIFFLIATIALTYALSRSVYSDLLTFRLLADSKQSLFAVDSALEDMVYRFKSGMTPDATEVIEIGNVTASSTATYDNVEEAYLIFSEAINNHAYRASEVSLAIGAGASFNFGVQSGNGGFELTNGSSVIGNVFSNGTVRKTGGGTATIYGDVISAASGGLIEDVNATGSVWAHIVRDSNVGGNAYAYTLDGGNITGGAEYFEKIGGAVVNGTPEVGGVVLGDEATTTMPISDEDIELIKQDILDNGTVIASTSPECTAGPTPGEYFVDDDVTLGLVKIECNFQVKKQGSATVLTLTGAIWVEGNILFKGGPTVVIDSGMPNRAVPIVADNESNRVTSSSIVVENGTSFTGTGGSKSYIVLLSQNNDAEENGGTTNAISLGQSSTGDLLVYASHGLITLANSISLNEITGYKIKLGNSASVEYKSGLVNLLFTSGPGGGFTIGSWNEVH